MSQEHPKGNEFASLSPKERQTELRVFNALIPYDIHNDALSSIDPLDSDSLQDSRESGLSISKDSPLFDVFTRSHATYTRRENGETLKRLENRLTGLVQLAPVTDSFRQYIVQTFRQEYIAGVDQDTDDQETQAVFAKMLDLNNNESVGIFSEDTAKELERKAYHEYASIALLFAFELPAMLSETWGVDLDKVDHKPKEDQKLQQWRRDFVQNYQDEP